MKNHIYLILFLLCMGIPQQVSSQEEKPKVALVLSGGGAKGIAHIPLLQTLDSLGIVPDLIIGTSMGSVVGGFYAAGFSGDSISYIAHTADWSELLGGDISLDDVSMEEKSEFKRHLVDFDIIEGKPKVNSGLLKDQKLREFLSSYTYPVFNIDDFDDLPIPYRAMTTDIVNGKEVLFEEGSLNLAMRASMSIPGVFEPVPYEGTLLVDGGVLNNFPVDVAKEMGYDIIIGSDVGGGMQKKEALNSIPSLLFQTGMLTSNLKNPSNREACDILIDHMPYLTYSTGDFTKAAEIYKQGKQGTKDNLEYLVELAEQLKGFEQREHKIPEVKNAFVLDSVFYKGVSEANIELVKARADIHPGTTYSTQELIAGIDRAMGTNLFNQITYDGGLQDGKLELHLNGFERSQNVIKGSLHYDSYRSVGVMVNYTGRNVIGKASRFLVTADIAVQPRFRVQYQKLFGPEKTWWWRSEVLGEFLDQKFFLRGEVADDWKSNYFQFDNQFNKNLNSLHSYAGIGFSYEYSRLKPKIDPDINDNLFNLERYSFSNFEVDLHYLFSKMDQVYFPTKGTFFRGGVARSFIHDVVVDYSEEDFQDISGPTNGFSKLNLDFEHRWRLNDKLTGIVGANVAFIFEDDLKSDDNWFSDYGFAAKYSLGGTLLGPRKGTYIFPGLHEDELIVSQMMRINLAMQINPFSKFFLTPHVNLASVGFRGFEEYIENAFSPQGNWSDSFETSSIVSAGVNVGYNSFLGPLNFDISYVNDINKIRVFFSIGILFNRSN
ncbi:patatin-like phospholipase family protein [Lutimonas zeaxanthinifaciens]|uniref:patatin-like phospholipase family protein n=1 Tax=Lutimonas zeaxanthinifaciens TaxID=3060215 RepID=UPI00265C8DDB|nr:patatin-like phospholipase family protein [Lutimonas sp. YSD2104]WKK66684.1 patatin-like phospholipase family protein [Lutimonas sp. YSD2104]